MWRGRTPQGGGQAGAEMGAGSRADPGTPGGWEEGIGPRSHRGAAHSAGMKLGGFGVDWEGS